MAASFVTLGAVVFFRSSAFHQQFVELCVTSYPSPLDNSLPRGAKLFLFAVASLYEYFTAWCNVQLIGLAVSLIVIFSIYLLPLSQNHLVWRIIGAKPFGLWQIAWPAALAYRFALRAKSFLRYATRNERGVAAQNIFITIAQHNPALICYVVLHFGIVPAITVLNMPYLEALKAFWTEEKMSFSWRVSAFVGISMQLCNDKLVKHMPKLLVRNILSAQSSLSYSEKGKDGRKEKESPSRPGLPESQPLNVTESLTSLTISRALALATKAADIILDMFIGPYTYIILLNSQTLQPLSNQDPASDQIRLLTILPAVSPSHPICTIGNWYSITSVPSYTAISYCWGPSPPVFDKTILVNKVETPVTESAYTALLALRSPFRARTVWLDAICINQDSDSEKERQIPLMPRIYAQAANVTIWLGLSESAQAAYLATALIDRLFVVNRLRQIDSQFEYKIDAEAACALKRMLWSKWFGRAWVVQEVVRARGFVSVRYGPAQLDWTRLSWFLLCLSQDEALQQTLNMRIGADGLGEQGTLAIGNVGLMRRFSLIKGGNISLSLLFYLVQMFRSHGRFEAREKADYVYALIGLSESSATTFKLKPEYRKSLRELYVGIVLQFLDTGPHDNRLDFLAHAGTGYAPNIPGLPSWAPDWSVKPVCRPLFGTDGSHELLLTSKNDKLLADAASMSSTVHTSQNQQAKDLYEASLSKVEQVKDKIIGLLFNATKGMETYASVLDNGSVLEVRARKLCNIRKVGRCYEMPDKKNSSDSLRVLKDWVCLAEEIFTINESGRNPFRADLITSLVSGHATEAYVDSLQIFAEVLATGISSGGHIDYTFVSAPEKIDPVFVTLTRKLFEAVIPAAKVEQLSPEVRQILLSRDQIMPAPIILDILKDYNAVVDGNCVGRRFGITKSGKMGLFPSNTQVGDELALIAGAKVPFILRNLELNDKCFELVGPAFVNGIMYGEEMIADYQEFEMLLLR